MKIAIPTRDGRVDDHFGHCDHYTIYTIENNTVVDTQTLPSPQGCGCKSNIATTLKEMGVEVMLAGSMGDGALNKLAANGIRAIRGCSGDVEVLIKTYLTGFVFDSGVGCDHHDCGNH